MNQDKKPQPLRVVYVGTTGQFSLPPLEALLHTGIDVCGIVVPAQPTRQHLQKADIAELRPPSLHSLLPIVNPFLDQNIVLLAWQHNIPVYEIHKLRSHQTLEQLAALGANIGCVACFPRRLPLEMLNLLPDGWLNVHPSLLPAYRGPAPLFWIMRNGIEAAGVTIHAMNADFDTGDIAAQAPVVLGDGIDGVAADQRIAARGGELLVDVLHKLQHGTLRYHKQSETATTAPWPTASDFQLDVAWSAQRAFNFMRGTAEWQHPYLILVGDQHVALSHAVSYSDHETLPNPYWIEGNNIQIQFAHGVLQALTIETDLLHS